MEKTVFLLPCCQEVRSEEGLCEVFGFHPPVRSFLLPVLLGRAAPFIPLAPEPECLGHFLPTPGARASELTFMVSTGS